jgi:hypothetical protein
MPLESHKIHLKMKIILIFVIIFMFFQQNEANNNTADYFKSLKYKQPRNIVYNMNAEYNQGIEKRSNLPDYENLKGKLLNIDCKKNQSIKIKSDKNKENKIGYIKSLKPKSFRDRVYHMNFKYNQGIWLRIG